MAWWSKKSRKSLFDYFEEHSAWILEAVRFLGLLFYVEENRFNSDAKRTLNKVQAACIKDCERRGDQIKRDVRILVSRTFITPIDKDEALRLIDALDAVLNAINAAANAYAVVYEFTEPQPFMQKFAELLNEAAHAIRELCRLLRKAGPNAARINELCKKIHDLEHAGDEINQATERELFLSTDDVRLTMARRRICALLEKATDNARVCAAIAGQIAADA